MAEIRFSAAEYQPDQSLLTVQYRYVGSLEQGWQIEREGVPWLALGPGYVPVKTLYCGICSTDLARHFLPFPLPQITGHELVGEYAGEVVAVEINASHVARGIADPDCAYCRSGLEIHCPERLTLGIDRLPGGFSPWVLAPVQALHPLPATVSPQAGVLIEPFAAAVKAVEESPPAAGERVAVLGPRRLGMLIIAALNSHRQLQHKDFEITAVMRHASLSDTARRLGADRVILIDSDRHADLQKRFDLVFDTTGSPAGFELAMTMAKHTVHLKSTHGKPVMGFENLTSMVINEQVVSGFTEQKLLQLLSTRSGGPPNKTLFISPELLQHEAVVGLDAAWERVSSLDEALAQGGSRQFDLALVSSSRELNQLTRPLSLQGQSLLKATGTVLVAPEASACDETDLISKIYQQQLQIVTSRCGSFARTMDIFRQLPALAATLQKHLVTQTMDVGQLAVAMRIAGQSAKSIKVVIKTN